MFKRTLMSETRDSELGTPIALCYHQRSACSSHPKEEPEQTDEMVQTNEPEPTLIAVTMHRSVRRDSERKSAWWRTFSPRSFSPHLVSMKADSEPQLIILKHTDEKVSDEYLRFTKSTILDPGSASLCFENSAIRGIALGYLIREQLEPVATAPSGGMDLAQTATAIPSLGDEERHSVSYYEKDELWSVEDGKGADTACRLFEERFFSPQQREKAYSSPRRWIVARSS